MNENEATMPAMDAPRSAMTPGAVAGMGEQVRLKQSHETSYIDHQPDNQVVLSPRLEQLVRRVGGCQTDEVLALVRRIMYEMLSSRKY
jgi:hypothetical protein